MKNKKRWIFLGIVALLLIIFGAYRYFIYVLQDQWSEKDTAIAKAKQEAGIVSVADAQKSVWDQNSIYWVVEGTNKTGQEVMVWVQFTDQGKPKEGQNTVHQELLSSGMSKEKMKAKIKSTIPGIKDMRLVPGVYNGEYVWQLFYKVKDHYYYQFYRFSDGAEIGSPFTLPNR